MADVREAFRASTAASGLTKAQARALRAQRKAKSSGAQHGEEGEAHRPSAAAHVQPEPSASDVRVKDEQPRLSEDVSVPASKRAVPPTPAVAVQPSNVPQAVSGAAAKGAPLPQGFFDDKAADAEAHGKKVLTKRDKDAEFMQFQLDMDEEIKKQIELETLEAEQATARQDAEEEFEVRARMSRIEKLKKRDLPDGIDGVRFAQGSAKKTRVQDVVKALQADDVSDNSESEDDVEVDWRSKRS